MHAQLCGSVHGCQYGCDPAFGEYAAIVVEVEGLEECIRWDPCACVWLSRRLGGIAVGLDGLYDRRYGLGTVGVRA